MDRNRDKKPTRAAVAEAIKYAIEYMLDNIDTDIYHLEDMIINVKNNIISIQYDKDEEHFEMEELLNV